MAFGRNLTTPGRTQNLDDAVCCMSQQAWQAQALQKQGRKKHEDAARYLGLVVLEVILDLRLGLVGHSLSQPLPVPAVYLQTRACLHQLHIPRQLLTGIPAWLDDELTAGVQPELTDTQGLEGVLS